MTTFRDAVSRRAYQIYLEKMSERRYRNWFDAVRQVSSESNTTGYFSEALVSKKAHELWLMRKDVQAVMDWIEAEQQLGYEINPISTDVITALIYRLKDLRFTQSELIQIFFDYINSRCTHS